VDGLIDYLPLFDGRMREGTPPSSIPSKVKPPSVVKKKEEPAKVAEKKEPEKKEEYSYNPAGKPDPFRPFIQLISAKGGSKTGPLTPLQKYDISQLRLVAIISNREEILPSSKMWREKAIF